MLRCFLLVAVCEALVLVQPPVAAHSRAGDACMMGRKFENNKMKMAKSALAYAKKVRRPGKPRAGAIAYTCSA